MSGTNLTSNLSAKSKTPSDATTDFKKQFQTRPQLSTYVLNFRLWVQRRGMIFVLACLLCLLGSTGWLISLAKQAADAKNQQLPGAQRTLLSSTAKSSLQSSAEIHSAVTDSSEPADPAELTRLSGQNFLAFYENLGERRFAEQQLKTIFAIAQKNGLKLDKGQYKLAFDKTSQVHTYQIMLPLNGTYPAVWQFTLQVLSAIPFASLDEISFKREVINQPSSDVSLRFTLYLNDKKRQP